MAVTMVVVVMTGFVHTATAQTIQAGDIDIVNPWARASVPNTATGAAYVTLNTRGAQTDRLESLSTPVAKRAEIHGHRVQDGVMKMEQLPHLDVAPGTPVVFEPGGLHIMLMGLEKPLTKGETFELTLRFEHTGPVTIQVPVQALTTISYEGSVHHGDSSHQHGSKSHN